MATGKSGQFDLVANKAGITVLVDWVETYNTDTNTSTVTITKVQGKSTQWYGVSYFLQGSIAINGVDVVTFDEDHYLYWDALNTFADLRVRDGATLPPWESAEITHNDDGTKTVYITFSFSGITDSGGADSGWVVDEVVAIALTDIPVDDSGTDTPGTDVEPEVIIPTTVGFYYDGVRVISPMYEGKIIGMVIVPPVLGTEVTVTGTVIRVDDVVDKEHALKIQTEPGAEVSVYGKNLFNVYADQYSGNSGCSSAIVNDELVVTTKSKNAYISANFAIPNGEILVGKTVTVTGEWVVSGSNVGCLRLAWAGKDNHSQMVGSIGGNKVSGTAKSYTISAKPDNAGELCIWIYGNYDGTGAVGDTVTYKYVQLEIGSSATDYESYTEQTATADENGKVEGLKSVAPTMTVVGDEPVECTYLRR